VLVGQLPASIQNAAEMYAGCVSGALQKEVYLEIIQLNGFENITLQKEKPIIIPDDILLNYLSAEEIAQYKQSGAGIYSITVFGEKPLKTEKTACCGPDCCS
jgi:arsenite methyltransferase